MIALAVTLAVRLNLRNTPADRLLACGPIHKKVEDQIAKAEAALARMILTTVSRWRASSSWLARRRRVIFGIITLLVGAVVFVALKSIKHEHMRLVGEQKPHASWAELYKASWPKENTIAAIGKLSQEHDFGRDDPDHDPMAIIGGTDMEAY